MLKKHIIFQILYIIVGPLYPVSLKRFVFCKASPSDKCSLLWLANWHSALWLAEHHKPCRKCNAPFHNRELQLSKLKLRQLIMSLVLPSVQAWERNRVVWQTQWWCSYVFANKGCTLRCDVTLSLSLTHTHTQAAIKIADVLWCDPVSLSHTHTHKPQLR